MTDLMIIFRVGEPPEFREVDAAPTLEELQALVGGYIEIPGGTIRLSNGDRAQMILNEEGLLQGLPPNQIGTVFAVHLMKSAGCQLAINHIMVGTVVILINKACVE